MRLTPLFKGAQNGIVPDGFHATGNMAPCCTVKDGAARPVNFYTLGISEFAVGKLHGRGSLSAKSIVTNVQDFLVNLARNLA